MLRFVSVFFLLVAGSQLIDGNLQAQSNPEPYFSTATGLRFKVPAGTYVVERTLYSDAHSESLSKIQVIRVLPVGTSEEESLRGLAGVSIEVYQPAPVPEVSQWASVERGQDWEAAEEWIDIAGQEALVLRLEEKAEGPRGKKVILIQERQGFLFSSPDEARLDALLKTVTFGAPSSSIQAGSGTPWAESVNKARPPRVRMVYLVPSDRTVNESYRLGMDRAIRELQSFYRRQLGLKTFSLYGPVVEVVRTSHPVSWYTTNAPASSQAGRFWESVVADGFALKGGRFNDPENRWIFYIDADPLCEQYVGGTSGVALLPANDLRGLTCGQNVPVCGGTPDNAGLCRWVGGLGHELGHSFNLPHPEVGTCPGGDPDCDHALMWLGYISFPNAYLLPSDKQSLLGSEETRRFFRRINPRPVSHPCTEGCGRSGSP